MVLKDIVPDYPALVQFFTYAGVDLLVGWKPSGEHPTNLVRRVRAAVFSLLQAPNAPGEMVQELGHRPTSAPR